MNPDEKTLTSRRQFLKAAGGVVAASTLTAASAPMVHAAGSDLIQVALVGCGGRGSGAAVNALSTKSGPIKLVAMADVFEDRLKSSYGGLTGAVGEKMDVPQERRFLGFDAYRKAMDSLKPGDVVILTTPLAFRWVHFTYAIEKKLNVFMEKPLTADGPTSKKMFKLADDSIAKNLKVGVGLMSRHSRPLQELHDRIQNGEVGDIIAMRGYRMQGLIGHFASRPKPENMTDLEYQIRRFHSFLWAGGGGFSDYNIHIIDHLSWMKNAWPVKAQSVGGRHYRQAPDGTTYVDQNFDSYGVEYTFPDGSKFFYDGRCMEGAATFYASYVHGTKGLAIASRFADCGAPSSIYKGQNEDRANMLWESKDRSDPYQNEWDELIDAIRNDKPYNEVKRGVEASLTTSMGRMAAHTGQEISFQDMLNCPHEFAPGVDKLMTRESPAPLQPDAKGRYPVPQPGIVTTREY
ncbi:MAG TPA: Gfo/Idh/MocA family oxidoreductase [Chthonomonadaceae bacterium]|nr:Gfo/Idh/MocA family oxidoreductase [Chthonomonadaceae bacterium]